MKNIKSEEDIKNTANTDSELVIAEKTFSSRLFLGTGKFSSSQSLRQAVISSGAEVVTVALRRVDFSKENSPKSPDDILEILSDLNVLILPNTSGARHAQEAIRLARLARSALGHAWVKLELTPEPRYLLPDPIETLKATEELAKEDFKVLPYINADPVLAKRLAEAGAVTVMPLGAPIGSNRGIRTIDQIKIIIEQSTIPVVVDAGLGRPSHASEAMEIGSDAVLVNTAISISENPEGMAKAFSLAVRAGRLGYLSGLPSKKDRAEASSPLTAFLN